MYQRPVIMSSNAVRLDAAESVWFKRQLESVDRQMYEVLYPENKARQLIPTQQGIPDWAKIYTWRMFDKVGRAKIISNKADDLPRVDATGEENSRIIKPVGASYGWDIFEIKASFATGTSLDAMKGAACRHAVETEVDGILGLGNTDHKLEGLLNITGVTADTAAAKSGGGTEWAGASPEEIQLDISTAINAIIAATKSAGGPVFRKFVIVIPDTQYADIAQRKNSTSSDTTILRWLLDNNPFIEAIEPWHLCAGAGAGSTDRMAIYPRNQLVLAGIVPMEFATQEPEKRGIEYVIDGLSTCGGVVARYLFVMRYVDGI